MPWKKLGRIFDPAETKSSWFRTHAALPVVQRRSDDLHRVYFSGRDAENRAQIGWFEFELCPPYTVRRVSEAPVIAIGELGTFDDRGVTASCIVEYQGRWFQYYSGWTLGVTVPFYFFIGLAISEDGENYTRISQAPIMGRHAVDPYLLGSPFVRVEDGLWRMWYISAIRWSIVNGRPRHYYLPKYAESRDGINWTPTGHICLNFANADEYAFARPHVIYENNIYKMWFSYRGESYRIGYAESDDGINWTRKDDQAGIDVSAAGWDSEMIEYPYVFDHDGVRYMLYNGNGYGATGIGLAVWED